MGEPLKIAQIGDVHFGVQDAEAIARAREIIETEQPDILIACGDLTQRGKRIEFQQAFEFLDAFDVPVMSVPGNHDVPLLDLVSRIKAPFKRYREHLDRFEPVQTIRGTTIFGLNSARGWHARANWAEGSINLHTLQAAINQHAPSILVAHHPFVQPPKAQLSVNTRRGKRALHIAAQNGVKLILTGHVHEPTAFEFSSENRQKLVSVSCGTLSRRLRKAPPSFNIIEMNSHKVSVRVINADTGRSERDPMHFTY